MKKILLTLATSALLISSQVQAGSDFYVNVPVGYSKAQKPGGEYGGKIKNSIIYGLGAGYNIADGFRSELNLNFRNGYKYKSSTTNSQGGYNYSVYSTQDIKVSSLFLDVYKDFDIGSSFSPYLMAGIGYSKLTLKPMIDHTVQFSIPGETTMERSVKKSKNKFSWQVGLGASVKISDSMTFDVGYRYTKLPSLKTVNDVDDIFTGKLSANEALVGLRVAL